MKRWAAVARFGGVGDNLIAGSPLKALKRMGYMCEVITGGHYSSLYQHNPYIDKLTIKKTEEDLPQGDMYAWQKWMDSRAKEYDVFVHASHSCEGLHSLFKGMTQFWWPAEMRRKICAGSFLETVHDIAGVPYDFGPLFFASPEEWAMALLTKRNIGERFILWVLSGTRIDKVYPYAPQAIGRIIKEVGAPVLLMGGPSEKEQSMADRIVELVSVTNGNRDGLHLALPKMGTDACWPIRTSMTMALSADLVVTPDTGTAWAVAFEPMPKVVMVSHSSAENITKHWVNTITLHADPERVPCWPCHRLHDDPSTCRVNKEGNGAACISDISVEKLVSTVAEAWKRDSNVIHAEQIFGMAHSRT
jgi:ADP-heptose:LPS heptosyltransferase